MSQADRQAVHQCRQQVEAAWSAFAAFRPRDPAGWLAWRWYYRKVYRDRRQVRRLGAALARDMAGDE